jgi:hypothetical protein
VTDEPVYVVSGLPRSGTSLLMAMLRAAGIPPRTDHVRVADADNPRGYWEYEPTKKLLADSSWVPGCRGEALKVVSELLAALPLLDEGGYRVIFMRRRLDDVLASQAEMLRRLGRAPGGSEDVLRRAFVRHVEDVERALSQRADTSVLYVPFERLVADPLAHAERVATFVGRGQPRAMAAVVEPALVRQKR